MDYDIYISQDDGDVYFVRVCDADGTETVHRVTVSGEQVGLLGLSSVSTHRILQHTFLFLLEREGPKAILGEFALGQVTDYYPEFPEEIKGRVAAG